MVARAGLLVALLASLVASPADAARGESLERRPGLPTPELLERAVARGDLTRATADRFLALALRDHRRVPDRFLSAVPWDGTIPLLRLRERLARMPPGPSRRAISDALGPTVCDDPPPEPAELDTTHFHIHHDAADIEPSLDINDYATSLETSWTKEITDFGWAEPPPGFPTLYSVVVEDLGPGLYGFVQATSLVGNNPDTTWNDVDALASCMALNEDYTGFPSPPQASLDATTAHEFNHSIQFGYGALTGPNAADDVFVEGGATWIEDEVFDGSDDNHNYLWPDFTQSIGAYPNSFPYPYWVVFRALTERFGTGTAGGGEQVMQDFWEQTSQSLTSNQFPALNAGLAAKGTTLADAFHEGAIALRLGQACDGPWAYPLCLEENPDYVAEAGPVPQHGSISLVGGSFTGSIRDDYTINWVRLPSSGPYPVTLRNTSSGGILRASAACVTGAGPSVAALPAVAGPGGSAVLPSFDPSGCTQAPFAVITNQAESAANPMISQSRSYQLLAGLLIPTPKTVRLKAKPRSVVEGDRTRLRAKVLPCTGHEGDVVRFLRKKKRIATKKSSGVCVAMLRVEVQRTTVFQAVSPQQDADHLAGASKKVKVRVLPA